MNPKRFLLPLSGVGVGALFAIGLGVSGMTQPDRVVGFLDVTGGWDPTLVFVMFAAVITYLIGFRALTLARRRPVLEPTFQVPMRRDVDRRLVVGSAIFGAGWGLAGFCPGPAIATLPTGIGGAWLFVASMLVGMAAWHTVEAWKRRQPVRPQPPGPSAPEIAQHPTTGAPTRPGLRITPPSLTPR